MRLMTRCRFVVHNLCRWGAMRARATMTSRCTPCILTRAALLRTTTRASQSLRVRQMEREHAGDVVTRGYKSKLA
jgi:hypothetical protein